MPPLEPGVGGGGGKDEEEEEQNIPPWQWTGISTTLEVAHMGQIPQDGDFGQNMAFFLKKVEPFCDQTW